MKASRHYLPEPFVCFPARHHISNLGFCSYTNSNLPLEMQVGRYCSIAPDLRIMGESHPLDRITTHTFTCQNFAAIHREVSKRLGGSSYR